MSVTNITKSLRERGLIEQEGGGEMNTFLAKKRKVYLGIDPTADSLHVGNLVPILLMKHLADAGHEITFLVGGGTGMIGDPRESGERVLLDTKMVMANTKTIHAQLSKIFGDKKYLILNNNKWLSKLGVIEFLRDIAKHFTVNQLIKREIIKKRLEAEDPLSFTEFSYSLLQAYDFLYLYRTAGIDLQVGGSDQWTNILSGVDLIRRKESAIAYALTTPIIIDKKSGKKFGKSEGNAVWLDSKKTSSFEFYQFWFNVPDEGVEDYLKIFTLLPLKQIFQVLTEHRVDSKKRMAQKKLAFEMTKIIHGKEAAWRAECTSDIIFGDVFPFSTLSAAQIGLLIRDIPGAVLTASLIKNRFTIVDALVSTKMASSKAEGRRLVEGKGVYLNNKLIGAPDYTIATDIFIQRVALLRIGKKVAVLSLKK